MIKIMIMKMMKNDTNVVADDNTYVDDENDDNKNDNNVDDDGDDDNLFFCRVYMFQLCTFYIKNVNKKLRKHRFHYSYSPMTYIPPNSVFRFFLHSHIH